MNARSSSGQILVLVLLVVLVALTIGLSIASRTLSSLKSSAELDQSNRAFNAAEAGVERALSLLKTSGDVDVCDNNNCKANIPGIVSKVEVDEAGGGPNAFGVANLQQDEVLQVNLEGFSSPSNLLDVYWGRVEDAGIGGTCQDKPAIVVSVVYRNTGSGAYGMGKAAYDKCDNAHRRQNGFDNASVSITPPKLTSLEFDDGTGGLYGFRATLNLTPGGPLVSSGSQPLLARARLMYATDKPVVFDPRGAILPLQGQQITSTAEIGGKQRTVRVLKTNPTLPAIFDYALFNGSTSPLSK